MATRRGPGGRRGPSTRRSYFESVNRSKVGLTLDLSDPDDLTLARELARRADILVENFAPRHRSIGLGLGYEQSATATRPPVGRATGASSTASITGYRLGGRGVEPSATTSSSRPSAG
jgi:hypothetical protein